MDWTRDILSRRFPISDVNYAPENRAGTLAPGNFRLVYPMQLGLENMAVIGNELALRWTDGSETYFPLEFLRKRCPCALCAGERDLLGNLHRGEMKLGPASFQLKRCAVVGGYGIQPEWTDGHSSGIYSFSYLKSLDPEVT